MPLNAMPSIVLPFSPLRRYSLGRISVLDRAGSEGHVCECYAVVKNEYDRLLEDIPCGALEAP